MKKYIFSKLIFSSLLLILGCSKFEDLNTNPNQPVSIKSELLLNNIMYSTFGDDGDVANQLGMYSTFIGFDMGASWAQHMSKTAYDDEDRYFVRTTIIQSFWNTIYEDVCNDADKMYNLAVSENNKVNQGIALTLKAYGFSVLTDCYGDIPFSEALKSSEGNFAPKYDNQEDIYVGILSILDQANILLSSGEGAIPANSDRMYGGDVTKWRKFANSLKFRCLMRTSNKTTPKINLAAQLQEIASSRPIFTSNDDDAIFAFGTAQPAANPFYESIVYGGRIEHRLSNSLVEKLKSLNNDPRLQVYSRPNTSSQYIGKPTDGSLFLEDDISQIGLSYLQPESPAYFMTYSQLQFLLAEARQKGLISTGNADTYFYEGVKASFLANGLSELDFNTYKDLGSIDYNPVSGLTQIATQEWISLYGQGVEAWTEWRRTKIPVLNPVSGGAVSEIPSRYTYPLSEQSINSTNYNAAIASQGSDLLTTKIWWLKP
ncbi:MAG: SusD/RagB family nutrient-binding outer membrane lipoprotein [Sphingobacteriales bacterium]|nr:SusD/RagB family nutrient-binding outer membrane lipoprotein [Sphingobacteriales bacterium]